MALEKQRADDWGQNKKADRLYAAAYRRISEHSMDRGRVMVFGSEYVGSGDDTLGFAILMDLLERLVEREDRPKALIFWNTAVKLLAEGSPAVPRLKALEEKGVKILAGRFCLADLCIADKVAAGKAAGMDEILDLILHNNTISL